MTSGLVAPRRCGLAPRVRPAAGLGLAAGGFRFALRLAALRLTRLGLAALGLARLGIAAIPVRVLAVVGEVESRALEEKPRSARDLPVRRLTTLGTWDLGHRLREGAIALVEHVPVGAPELVSRHSAFTWTQGVGAGI